MSYRPAEFRGDASSQVGQVNNLSTCGGLVVIRLHGWAPTGELAPRHRARLGIDDNLVRLSAGIEAVEDIIADLDQALA